MSLFNSDRKTAVYPVTPWDPRKEKHYIDLLEREKTPETVVDFLNKWGVMRHGYNRWSIRKGLLATYSTISALRGKRFETTNLTTIEGSIDAAFRSFVSATGGSSTAAAKMLHLLLPDLAPIWDNRIRIAYGCGYSQEDDTEKARAYLKFGHRLRRELDECLNSYAADHTLSERNDAARQLKSELYDGGKSVVKILDEYNFMKYTKCLDELWI